MPHWEGRAVKPALNPEWSCGAQPAPNVPYLWTVILKRDTLSSCFSHCIFGPLCYNSLAWTLTNTLVSAAKRHITQAWHSPAQAPGVSIWFSGTKGHSLRTSAATFCCLKTKSTERRWSWERKWDKARKQRQSPVDIFMTPDSALLLDFWFVWIKKKKPLWHRPVEFVTYYQKDHDW